MFGKINKISFSVFFILLMQQLFIPGILFAQDKPARLLVIEIGGLTFENLERAYTPNLNVLINNGLLTSMSDNIDTSITHTNYSPYIRRLFRQVVRCIDTSNHLGSSYYYVGSSQDTLTRSVFRHRVVARSDQSMIINVLNANNTDSFSYVRFKGIPVTKKPIARFQINYLTTVDSLIGLVFKNLQEKQKWKNTCVLVIGDGIKAHQETNLEQYSGIPVIFSGNWISKNFLPYANYSINDIISSANELMQYPCGTNSSDLHLMSLDSTRYNPSFLNRPDILISIFKFENKLGIDFYSDNQPGDILYTINEDDPLKFGKVYKQQIVIDKAGTYNVKAVSRLNGNFSALSQQNVTLYDKIQYINSEPLPDATYAGDGPNSLISGDTALVDFHDLRYLGYQGEDVEFKLNFGSKRSLKKIELSALQDQVSWIFFPSEITFYVGNDFQTMLEIGKVNYEVQQDKDVLAKRKYSITIDEAMMEKLGKLYYKKHRGIKVLSVRCLKIKVNATKKTPDWFHIPGAQAWFFTDEIILE